MNADWVMVIITGIYVIATIFICLANFKSAKASKEQLREMQRQFDDINRPFIETEFHYERRAWYIVRLINHGNKTAQHVKINIEQDFIDSLPEESFQRELKKTKGRECIIGVGQHYDLYIGSNKLRGNPNMRPLKGVIEYEAHGNVYQSEIYVDLEHYLTIYTSTTDDEEKIKILRNINEELKGIKKAVLNIGTKDSKSN